MAAAPAGPLLPISYPPQLFVCCATFLAADLVNYFKRRKCTVPCQGAFLDTAVYGRKGTGLQYGAAVFRYQADGVSYDQASLDKRFWLGFLTSPFSKTFKEGDHCTIYLNPNNPPAFCHFSASPIGALHDLRHFSVRGIFPFIVFALHRHREGIPRFPVSSVERAKSFYFFPLHGTALCIPLKSRLTFTVLPCTKSTTVPAEGSSKKPCGSVRQIV